MDEKAAISISVLSPGADKRVVGLTASALLLAFGALVVLWSSSTILNGKNSLSWQPVQGKLVSLQWHSPSGGADYPTAQYQYVIDGRQYQGDKICFGPASDATCKLTGLAAGGTVAVFVNPTDPHQSVLIPGASKFAKIFLGVGGLVFTVGLFLVGSTLVYHGAKS